MKKLLLSLSLSLFFSISNASALTISHVGEQFLGHGVSDLTFEVSSCEAYKNLVITLKFIGKDNCTRRISRNKNFRFAEQL